MSIDARLEELKQDLAQLRERRRFENKDAASGGRGREADHPGEIPPRGWKDILWRAWAEISDQNLFLIAGGVTYAVLLALFPGLAALVSLYGLAFDTAQIEKQVAALSGVLPAQTQELLSQQLHSLVEASSGALGFAAIVGLLLALWSASRGMSGLITAINIAYEEKERRSFLKFNLIALGLTLGLVIGGVLAIALIAVLPAAVQLLAVGSRDQMAAAACAVAAAHRPGDGWVSRSSTASAPTGISRNGGGSRRAPSQRRSLWIVASIGFTVYVANFNSYDKTYGSLGGVVILLTWLYLSALMVLLGAVINAQSERQTRKDFDRRRRRRRWAGAVRMQPTRSVEVQIRTTPWLKTKRSIASRGGSIGRVLARSRSYPIGLWTR